jgi:outer membrane protein insertion porin family
LRRPHPRPLIGRIVAGSAVALAAVLSATTPPRAAQAQDDMPAELKTIEGVQFQGRHHVSQKELRSVLKTKSPSWLPWRPRPVLRLDFLRADTSTIEFVYRQHGFLDATAQARRGPGHRHDSEIVTFVILEGPRYRISDVGFQGVTAVSEGTLRRRLHAQRDRPFNPLFLVADTALIADNYRERGYLPRVTAEGRVQDRRVSVTYRVSEGPRYRFGEVYLSSPAPLRTRDDLIRREFLFRKGDVYRASRVQRTVEDLYRTGLFSQVQMTPLPDSTHQVVEFDLRVRERPLRWLDAGIGSGTAERLRATGEWGHRNLNRRGLQTSTLGRLAFDGNANFILAHGELSFFDPWVLRQRRRGLATIYYANRNDRANPSVLIKQHDRGVNLEVRRYYSGRSQLVLTQKNAYVNQTQTFPSGVPDSTRDSLSTLFIPRYSTHSIQLAAERDRRDDLFNPTHGELYVLTGEIAGGPLQGTSSFTKGELSASWYLPVTSRWVLAARLRGGVIESFGRPPVFSPSDVDPAIDRVPLNDRFRIGGVNSIRGYNESQIPFAGGLAMAQANLELRLPLLGPLGAEVFVDAGNVWPRLSYIQGRNFFPGISDEPLQVQDVRMVAGVGARLNLPFGPLRVDVSWKARPEAGGNRRPRVQFALGPAF